MTLEFLQTLGWVALGVLGTTWLIVQQLRLSSDRKKFGQQQLELKRLQSEFEQSQQKIQTWAKKLQPYVQAGGEALQEFVDAEENNVQLGETESSSFIKKAYSALVNLRTEVFQVLGSWPEIEIPVGTVRVQRTQTKAKRVEAPAKILEARPAKIDFVHALSEKDLLQNESTSVEEKQALRFHEAETPRAAAAIEPPRPILDFEVSMVAEKNLETPKKKISTENRGFSRRRVPGQNLWT